MNFNFSKITAAISSTFNGLLAWMGTSLKQTNSAYCDLQTADSATVLVANDGSLVTVLQISGTIALVGQDEFNRIQTGLCQALQTRMSQSGHSIQVFFSHSKDEIRSDITEILRPATETAARLGLQLDDLFKERVNHLSSYCAHEEIYLVLWTRLSSLTSEQSRRVQSDKRKMLKKEKVPSFRFTQNVVAAIPQLRESHDSFVRMMHEDLNQLGLLTNVMEVHDAIRAMRYTVDPNFTDREWRPSLPGDPLTVRLPSFEVKEISDVLWPSLARQLLPRDGENLSLRMARIGDRIYSTVYVDLFPKDIQMFVRLFSRMLTTHVPWRISFLIDSNGMAGTGLRSLMTSLLAFSSQQNRLIHNAYKLLNYINLNTDDAVVKLRVAASTWAAVGEERLLRDRTAQLAKAIEGWGSCNVSEISGDAFAGAASTMMGVNSQNVATPSLAPLSNVLYMLPLFRPASPWDNGAMLFRTPDGKPWPYHPGSRQQMTWIDLFYARPGSGKSVLSNAINLAVCLSSGLQRLPHIAIIDIGPSSSGFISLLKDALPPAKKHWVAHHRLRMRSDYAINPFDTQLGCRYPTPQERAFLVNFLTLLATPVGADRAYDGVADMSGLIIDELYKNLADEGNPNIYASGVEAAVDAALEEIGFVGDAQTTWWEVCDALFMAGFWHPALLAQRHASPVLADVASICRTPAILDLYGKIMAPTGEPLIHAFSRMLSGAVREYPIISQVTRFDLGEARVVALDLDEVARTGGDAANRQTAVMYMLARYVLARHYYLTEDNVADMPEAYRRYHQQRIAEIREDPKRIVFDEFHRTSHAQAVRDQVIQDMREGRKWKVQVALLSQSLDDFDRVMVEFATSVFIMEAGPEQAVRRTAEVFGLSKTAETVLKTRVHGPRESGATFLAQFATKKGMNTQLLTATLGPVELWALSTTPEDVQLRGQLYHKLNPREARRVLANLFPAGSATKLIEDRLAHFKEQGGLIDEEVKEGVIGDLVTQIMAAYAKNPDVRVL